MRKSGQTSTYSYVQQKRTKAVQFGFLDQDEILRMSVANIYSERIYDEITLLPKLNAVNDPRMGVVVKDQACLTCFGDMVDCPGHFGHIELARPVYHVGLIDAVRKVLKVTCCNCSRLLIDDPEEKLVIGKIQYPKQRFFRILESVEKAFRRKCNQEFGGCGFIQPKYQKRSLEITVEHFDSSSAKQNQKVVLSAEEAHLVLSKISKDDQLVLGIERPETMIIRRLAVAPPAVRPAVSMGSLMRSEDDLTYSYQAIVKNNNLLKQQMDKGGNQTTINELTMCVQFYVATLMDNSIAGQPQHKQKSGKPLKAIKERLKGKEGRIRNNLMGKRVDFSARSVITPDPSLALDQLGVPIRVAINMTIPETVTPHNIDEMRNLIANGPSCWPGAKYIQRHDGRLIDLSLMNCRTDAHLEFGYIVERHLQNGDFVLFNRQPSLHKMSTMGHRIKVLPFSTFRLNLSVTSPYNADFDGDEMNMFVPQSMETKAEVKEIMHVPRQIVSPQSNKPVMGIVQDSLLGIMLFTKRETFLDKPQVMQLIMCLEGDIQDLVQLPVPAIVKPKSLWSGKQIMSLLIPSVNLIRNQSQKADKSTDYAPTKDKMVLISQGEHLAGELTKQIVGASSGGIIHLIWKEKGHVAARDFMSNLQKVVNCWLVDHGFTVGVQDAVAAEDTKAAILSTLEVHKRKVNKIINQAQSGTLKCQPGKNMIDSFEASVNTELNNARDKSGTLAFKNLGQFNKIQNMVSAGSKGTNINISQIMACVGQQNVEGQRIPFGFRSRTLPHFARYDYGPESKGFVSSNYISGLDPTEFYFHAMGGREGLIDTAVKTSETGYIQRRLVKALEDVMVRYDATVRNSQGGIVQFIYGEDGMAGESIEDLRMETVKYSDAQMKHRYYYQPDDEELNKILDQNTMKIVLQDPDLQELLSQEYQQIIADRDKLRTEVFKLGDDSTHLPLNIQRLIMTCRQVFELKAGIGSKGFIKSDLKPQYIVQEVQKLCESLHVYPGLLGQKQSEQNQNATQLTQIYIRSQMASKRLIFHEKLNTKAFDWLCGEVRSRFEQSLVHPGEVVGSIAAHSLGEPATQMTLNTFHFAGVSSKNVTLGVPRLKEIINVSKNLKAPNMQIYLKPEYRKSEANVMKVQGLIEHTTLMDLIDSSQIIYDPDYTKTIVQEDQQLVILYNEVQVPDDNEDINSPWLLRLVLSQQKMLMKQVEIDFVEQRLTDKLGNLIQVMHSDTNADKQIVRIRLKNLRDEEDESAVALMKECENDILNEIILKGIPEIQKVYAKKYTETEFCAETGEMQETEDNWMLETDGVCLRKILNEPMIDATRTISNDILEIRQILGIEAARQSLLNELRHVLSFYGIYVNYRHLATLCDVMVQKGRLTSITRHGINRLDSGPLRKSSFEETVEILLEASLHSEKDNLLGVTENIMLGQLAPIGTGSFDVVMDARMLAKYGQEQAAIWDENEILGTPVMAEEMGYGNMTPCVGETPHNMRGGRTSEYGGTPGMSVHDAAFSPGFNNAMSPAYASPHGYVHSPGYGSPTSPTYRGIKVQSPIYNNFVSPIYTAGSGMGSSPTITQSPTYNGSRGGIQAQSPNYSPGSRQSPYNSGIGTSAQSGNYAPIKSNYSPNYSPSANAQSPASPNYSPTVMPVQSPNYSPNISVGRGVYTVQSPNYSPSGGASGYGANPSIPIKQSYSPSYSPTGGLHQVFKSPAYSPNLVSGGAKSPFTQQSPKPAMGESPYVPAQVSNVKAAYMPTIQKVQSPTYNPVTSPLYKQETKEEEKEDDK